MKEFPDPKQYLDEYVKQSTQKYTDGLQHMGIEPHPILTNALFERALQEASDRFRQEVKAVRDHTIHLILQEHKKRMRALKWSGARRRLKFFPLIAACFGLAAWYCFTQPGGLLMGICYIVVALPFLAMPILGAIFDKPGQ